MRNKPYSLAMFKLGERPRDTERWLENCSPRRTKPELYTNIRFNTDTLLLAQSQPVTSDPVHWICKESTAFEPHHPDPT